MKRLKCTVSYVGSHYDGWQTQKNGRSIQEKIEEALARICQKPVVITAAGRTDAGVSAKGQVFHFDTERDMTPYKWKGALNGMLPDDIHIMQIEEVSPLFHARYCVKMKQYDYRINLGPYDVFTKDIAWQCPYKLDVEKMKKTASYLVGTHDFTSLNANPLAEKPDQVRTVKEISFSQEGDILKISFLGKGFLRYMVRMMCAQLIEAGRGKMEPEEVVRILEAKSKTASRKNAVPEGLTLQKVEYFEIIALSDDRMVREILEDDDVPEERKDCFVCTVRNDQEILGYYDEIDAVLYLLREDEHAAALCGQLEERLKEKGIRRSVKTVLL